MYQFHGLVGSYRIVFEDMCQLLSVDEPVSIEKLADKSGYSRRTVIRAIKHLRKAGMIETKHETNGKRAEYIVLKENGMFNPSDVLKALFNAVTMPNDERSKRLMIAVASKNCYDAGRKLKRLASKVGGDFEKNVHQWLDDNGVLNVMQVWELETAYLMHDQIQDLIAQAEEKLK